MKKILVIVGSLLGLLIVALLLVPFFYPVDSLKPKLESAINAQIRGRAEIGKISIRAFPRLKLNLDQLKLSAPAPYNQSPLATVERVEVSMSLLSLLTSPGIDIAVQNAHVQLVQNVVQNIPQSNLHDFLPPPKTEAELAKIAADPEKNKALGETLQTLPSFVANRVRAARVSFRLQNSEVIVRDLKAPAKDKTELHALEVALLNIGLATPIAIELAAQIDIHRGNLAAVGPVQAKGTVQLKPDGKNNLIDFNVVADQGQLDVSMKPLLHKPAGTAFSVAMEGQVLQGLVTDVDLRKLEFRFAELSAAGKMKLTNATALDPKLAKVSASFKVDDVKLAPFGAIVPMVREYKLGGGAQIKALVEGSLAEPVLDVIVNLRKVSGSTPQLKRPISDLNGQISVTGTTVNPKIVVAPFALKIGASDLNLKLQSSGLEKIVTQVQLSSKRFDADELLGLTPAGATTSLPTKSGGKGSASPVAAQALDESLDALAPTVEEALKNPMLDQFSATVSLDFKSIKAMNAEFTDSTLNLSYAGRQLKVSKSGLGGYGGRLSLDALLGLNAKLLSYEMAAGLTGVRVQDMIAAHAPKWKDVMTGTMTGDLKVTGKGLRKNQIAENLSGGIKGDLKSGRLNLPIVKIVGGVMDKLPAVGGKKIELPNKNQAFKGEFKTMHMAAALHGRNVQLQDLDVLYDTMQLGIGDLRFKANGNVSFDRQVDISGTAFLNPQYVRVDPLKGPSGQIEIPLKVRGDLSDPSPDYGYTLNALTPRLAQSVLKSKAAQDAIEKIKQNAPAPVQKGIDALKKRFGF